MAPVTAAVAESPQQRCKVAGRQKCLLPVKSSRIRRVCDLQTTVQARLVYEPDNKAEGASSDVATTPRIGYRCLLIRSSFCTGAAGDTDAVTEARYS